MGDNWKSYETALALSNDYIALTMSRAWFNGFNILIELWNNRWETEINSYNVLYKYVKYNPQNNSVTILTSEVLTQMTHILKTLPTVFVSKKTQLA